MASSVTYTATLKARRETVQYLAALLHARRVEVGTRAGTRALGSFEQAVMVIRWFLDNTRVAGLGHDNHIARSTAYDYLHEGIDVLAAKAPACGGPGNTSTTAGTSRCCRTRSAGRCGPPTCVPAVNTTPPALAPRQD